MKTNVQCPICGSQTSENLISAFEKSIKKDFEEELIRKETELSERLERARTEIREQTRQESSLKIKEKEKLISDLKEQLEKIRQKLENSSQQLIGEVQELELESILSSTFPTDLIEPVAKGKNGADCTQYVRTKSGAEIGKILFESKRVKSFCDGWIDKLKKDNLQANCDVMVIVTSTMPKDITGKFGVKDGVWICLFDNEAIKQLALVLRYGLMKVFEVTRNTNASETKAEKLYQFLTSVQFKNLFENVLKGFESLEQSFSEEKKKLTMLWKIREQHLNDMLSNTLELYAEMKGISNDIPEISTLEFRQAG